MVTIFEILGWIATIYDIWDTYHYNKYFLEDDQKHGFRELDPFTGGFIATHVIILFFVSFIMWCAS